MVIDNELVALAVCKSSLHADLLDGGLNACGSRVERGEGLIRIDALHEGQFAVFVG